MSATAPVSPIRNDVPLMLRVDPADWQRYGPVGSSIPGSRHLRDYCVICGQPIRVSDVRRHNACDEHFPDRRPAPAEKNRRSDQLAMRLTPVAMEP